MAKKATPERNTRQLSNGQVSRLQNKMLDLQIKNELEGSDKALTTSQMWQMQMLVLDAAKAVNQELAGVSS